MQFTLIRSDKPEFLTKRITLDAQGALVKTTVGHLSRGRATIETVADMRGFANFLEGLRNNEAPVYGIIKNDMQMAAVVTHDAYQKLPETDRGGVITRSNTHFEWGAGAGIMQLDVDPLPDGTTIPPDELLKLLEGFLPEASFAPKVIKPSASSCIYNSKTGEELASLRSYRIYIEVDVAAKIPSVAKALDQRLKAGGYGHIQIAKNGRMHWKSPIDMAVYTPCHMDFAAGAVTGEGLEQRRGKARVLNEDGAPLRTADVTVSEKVKARAITVMNELKAKAKPEALKVAAAWRKEHMETITAAGSSKAAAARAIARAVRGVLAGAYIIHVADRKTGNSRQVTVAAILADRNAYEGCDTLDPIEPEYDNKRVVGRLFLKDGKPRLVSFARGGQTYDLLSDECAVAPEHSKVLIREGGGAEAVDATVAALATTGCHFNMGSALVEVANGKATAWGPDHGSYRLGKLISYSAEKRVAGRLQVQRADPRSSLVRQTLSNPARHLPNLVACVDRPVPRLDGSLVAEAGYDPRTGLYLTRDMDDFTNYITKPKPEEVAQAVETCLAPFAEYTFLPLGWTAMLAAVLTAVVRGAVDLAPMIVVRSADIGAGKTLATTALAVLAQGGLPSTQTMPNSSTELRKLLLSLLLGGTEVIHLDNSDGILSSPVLCAFATSPLWSDRELGSSSMRTDLPNRCLILANGCNAVTANGLARRVIPVEIAPAGRGKMLRSYEFCPIQKMTERRDEIIGAALTLISAVPKDFRTTGSVATFSQWDRLVRRTIAWVSEKDPLLTDPIKLFQQEIAADAEQDGRRGLLEFFDRLIDLGMPERFFASDVVEAAQKNDLSPLLEHHLNAVSDSATTMSTRSVGTILSLLKDQDVSGLRLCGRKRKGRTEWEVVAIDASPKNTNS